MPNPHDNPAALKALQDAIYRDKVLRARSMTPDQRLAEVFELTNSVFERMHGGAMWQWGKRLIGTSRRIKAHGFRKIPLHRRECLIRYSVNVHSFPPRYESPMPQPAIGAERFPDR